MVGSDRDPRLGLGALLWVLQLVTLPVEWLAIAVVRAPYSVIDNTLSDLGAVGCGTVRYPGSLVEVCSPAHVLFNGSLFAGAVAVGCGAVLMRRALADRGSPRLVTAAVVLLVIAQLSGAATALVPIDVDLDLHLLVSTPVFVAQPVGLLLLGLAGRRAGAGWGLLLIVVGVGTALIGAFFIVRLDPAGGGLLERLILWPTSAALGLVGARVLHRRHVAGRPSTPLRPRSGG